RASADPLRRQRQCRQRARAASPPRRGRRPGRRREPRPARARVDRGGRAGRRRMSSRSALTLDDLPAPSVAIVVLDGWGLAPAGPGNAVSAAATPVFDALWERYPHTELDASGPAVGLPPGQMGN